MFFALGRDGLLPRALATTTNRETPLGGNLVVVAAGVAAVIFAAVASYGEAVELPNEVQAFFITAAAGTFLVTAVYVVLALVGFKLAWETRATGGLWWKLPAVLAGLAVPILAYKGSLDPWPDYPNNRAIIFALVTLGARRSRVRRGEGGPPGPHSPGGRLRRVPPRRAAARTRTSTTAPRPPDGRARRRA